MRGLFYCIILLAAFPPLPRSYLSEVALYQSLLVITIMVWVILLNVRRVKWFSGLESSLLYTTMGVSVWGAMLGIFNANQTTLIVKEIFYMLSPFLILLCMYCMNFSRLDFRFLIRVLVVYASFAALVQALYMWGAAGDETRYVDRWERLLMSSECLPLGILAVIVSGRSNSIASGIAKYAVVAVMVVGLISTQGRLQLLLVALMAFLWVSPVHFIAILCKYSVFLIFPFLYLYLVLFTGVGEVDDSIGWRKVEWLSYYLESGDVFSALLGEGLGARLETLYPLTVYGGETFTSVDRFHNIFLYLIFKVGLLGCFVYVVSFMYYSYRSIKACLTYNKAVVCSFIAFMFFVSGSFFGLYTMNLSSSFIFALLFFINNEVEGYGRDIV